MKTPATFTVCLLAVLIGGCSGASGVSDAGALPDSMAPVARMGGHVITESELAARARTAVSAADARHAEEVYNARNQALQELVEALLLEEKAKAEGLSVEALLARDVTSQVKEPDEAMLRSVYDQTKASGRTVPPYEESREDIARFLKDQESAQARSAYVAKLRAEAKVETFLPPLLLPKVDVTADGPSKGDPKAPVTIVEFSDYECGFCAQVEPTLATLLQTYPGRVRLVLQSYPLSIHAAAPKAAEAAFCAGDQGRYWEMHETLFANQRALGVDALKGYARAIGLDSTSFDACLDSGRMDAVVKASMALGDRAGVNSTPSFFVNGRPLSGAQPLERFQSLIDYELSAAAK